MAKLFLQSCTIFIILSGFLFFTHQVHGLGEYAATSDRKLNSEDNTRENGVQQNDRISIDKFKPSDLNWIPLDLREKGPGDWSNISPNKDSKDLTLENVWKNYERSGDEKNILKRNSDSKFSKENKLSRKQIDVRKQKEKQKKLFDSKVQKSKDRFRSFKVGGKKNNLKVKRTDEDIDTERQVGAQKKGTLNVYDNEAEEERDNSEDWYDLQQEDFYDTNTDLAEVDNNNKALQDEKNSSDTSEKEIVKQKSTNKSDSLTVKGKSKNNGDKNNKNLMFKSDNNTHADKFHHNSSKRKSKKLGKKQSKAKLNDEDDKNQHDNEALYSDWPANRKNKLPHSYTRHRERSGKKKHFNNDNERSNVEEQETSWQQNVATDFDNSSDVLLKGKYTKSAKKEDNLIPALNTKVDDLKNKQDQNEDELDFYEDINNDSNEESKSQIDSSSKSINSDHFLGDVSKFPVIHSQNSLHVKHKQGGKRLKNKQSKDDRKTAMIKYTKSNEFNNNKKNENYKKIVIDRWEKNFSTKNKQLNGNKMNPGMRKNIERESSYLPPIFNNIKGVYKLDPIAGHIELQNISDIIKKRSQRSYNYETKNIFNGAGISGFENQFKENSEKLPDFGICELTDERNGGNSDAVHSKDVFGPKNEMDIIYYDDENRPLLRDQRHLNENLPRKIREKNKTDTFENRFKQGWQSLKSKVLMHGEKNLTNSASSDETEDFSEPIESVSICSSPIPTVEIKEPPTRPCLDASNMDPKTKQNPDLNKGPEQEVSDMEDFLSGRLSERIAEEIINRLKKSSKLVKDLGIGNDAKNVSFEKCIPSEETVELISLEAMNKSMINFNSLLSQGEQKCYAVPLEMESFLKYLFSVEHKTPTQQYDDFPISDGSFIFDANFIKDMCPGECHIDSSLNASNINEDDAQNWDISKENENSELANGSLNGSINAELRKIAADIINDRKTKQENKQVNSETDISLNSKNVKQDIPQTDEIKIPSRDNIPDEPKPDSIELAEDYMPRVKDYGPRNKKTLESVFNQNDRMQNNQKVMPDVQLQRNSFDLKHNLNDRRQEQLKNGETENYNQHIFRENTFENNGQRILNERINGEEDIPSGFNPDLLDIEKVKKMKGKLDNIIYLDTPHFESGKAGNDMLKDRFHDDRHNRIIDVAENNEKLDEDGFEFADVEKAPMEYYDV